MPNTTNAKRTAVMDKLRRPASSTYGRTFLELGAYVAAGFITSRASLTDGAMSEAAPFGVALPAALSGKYAYAAAFGALLGYVLTPMFPQNVKYIGALLLVSLLKWLAEDRLERKPTAMWGILFSLFALAISTGVWIVAMDQTIYSMVVGAGELALVCGGTYFFFKASSLITTGLRGAGRAELACAVASVCIFLMGLSGLRLGGLSAGGILAALTILLCARYGGEAAGAIAGISTGAAIGLASGDLGFVASSYAIGGLASGLFGSAGRVAAAGVFLAVGTLMVLLGDGAVNYTFLAEIIVASAFLMLVPAHWMKGISIVPGDEGHTAQDLISMKLKAISSMLKKISDMTTQVSERLGRIENNDLSTLTERVIEKVCRHCGNRTACWQFRREEVSFAMSAAVKSLQRDGRLSRENTPKYLTRFCSKLDSMTAELSGSFHDRMIKENIQRKVNGVRSVMTDQFGGMAMMLEGLSGELRHVRQIESRKQLKMKEYLEREKFQVRGIMGYHDETGRVKLEATIPTYQLARLDKVKTALELSSILEAELDIPQVEAGEKESRIRFWEKASFVTEIGAHQIPNKKHKLCGDAYGFIQEQNGQAHMILSDGMGSGGSAAVDSSMTTNLLMQLLSVGVKHESALKLVNSALLVKSGEESLATIDICSIDLFTGKTVFYKAGAAPSIILRGGRAALAGASSLPAGILRGVSFEKNSAGLRAGDMVVMISDGVIATGADWVVSELERLYKSEDGNVQAVCEKLALTAQLRRQDGHSDDITVIAAMVGKGI